MKSTLSVVLSLFLTGFFVIANAYSEGDEALKDSAFDKVLKEAKDEQGIKLISYEQFQEIRNSGEEFILLDVLLEDSYKNGHIEGALNFPVTSINKETAEKVLKEGDKVIVYCSSFQCHASTHSAKLLTDLGFTVLDYKGGLKDWTEKGNKLVK